MARFAGIKLVCASVVVALFLFFPGESAVASSKSDVKIRFSASYSVDVQNAGTTSIKITFSNKGRNPTILTYYDLRLGDVRPENVAIRMGDRPLGFDVVESRGSTIRIKFLDVLLRPNQSLAVNVSYSLSPFFTPKGGGRDVILPVFRLSGETTADNITLKYPASFGAVNFSNTKYEQTVGEADRTLKFINAQDVEAVFVSIGDRRHFSFSQERKLKNDKDVFVLENVVLPPDISSQNLVLTRIDPLPQEAYRSEEGNLVLVFRVPPKGEVWARYSGYITSILPGDSELAGDMKGISFWMEALSPLQAITDEGVLKELETAEALNSQAEKISWIYSYVRNRLVLSGNFRQLHKLDYRKGANVALKTDKEASAEDFADVFVACAHRLGIPARLVAGYVFPLDVTGKALGMYHVWPQYFSSEVGWVSVDPAYEEYTGIPQLDSVGLNRVVLVVAPDSMPLLGFAETSDDYSFTDETVISNVGISAKIEAVTPVESGVSHAGRLSVTNTGNRVLYDLSFLPDGSDFDTVETSADTNPVVIPGQTVGLDFDFKVHAWYVYGRRPLKFTVVAENSGEVVRESVSRDIEVVALRWVQPVIWGLTVATFVVFTGAIYGLYRLGSWFVRSKLKSKSG